MLTNSYRYSIHEKVIVALVISKKLAAVSLCEEVARSVTCTPEEIYAAVHDLLNIGIVSFHPRATLHKGVPPKAAVQLNHLGDVFFDELMVVAAQTRPRSYKNDLLSILDCYGQCTESDLYLRLCFVRQTQHCNQARFKFAIKILKWRNRVDIQQIDADALMLVITTKGRDVIKHYKLRQTNIVKVSIWR